MEITWLTSLYRWHSMVGPTVNPTQLQDATSPVEFDNFQDLTQRTIEYATLQFSKKDFNAARQVLTELLAESETKSNVSFEGKPEIMGLLAISYLRQGNLEATEKITLQFIRERHDVGKCGDALWELFHSLAQRSICKEEFAMACQRAINVATKQFCANSVPYCRSVRLLIDIFERTEKPLHADRYKRLLKPGDSLLDYVYQGEAEIVSARLKGLSIKELNEALVVAVYQGHTEIVRLLLKNGADRICARDQNGKPVLVGAAEKGFSGIVELLLKEGANVNATEIYDGETSLMMATRNEHKDTVQVLLAHGANKRTENRHGVTALELTRRNKNRTIRRILRKG